MKVHDYLPLELVSVSQQGTLKDVNGANLTLSTSCGDIKLIYSAGDKPGSWNITMEIDDKLIEHSRIPSRCNHKLPSNFQLEENEFFSGRGLSYAILDTPERVDGRENRLGAISFFQLEFEIDGNPDIIGQGRFSKTNHTFNGY